MSRAGAQNARKRVSERAPAVAVCIAAAIALAGCGGLGGHHDNVANGKQQFVSRCGACHTLARAGTKGVVGPNLDAAFARARRDGMESSTFAGMVKDQIEHPSRLAEYDPKTGREAARMPANVVTGQAARDVAAYVGMVAGAGGKDTGRLASIGVKKAQGTAQAKGGALSIPTDPSGQLAYQFANARAPAGKLTIDSKNDAPIPHDIAIEGNGVNAKGAVVQNGGTSKLSVTLKPGSYTFYCSVPGHRQGGMVGKLMVK
jgi:plastocyanin/cytochrome c2